MENRNLAIAPSLKSCATDLVPKIYSYISGSRSKKCYICKSQFARKPAIIYTENADPDYMTVENFLGLVDDRMKKEIKYEKELILLKESIYKAFNELCDQQSNNKFNNLIMEARQYIIKSVIESTKIEKKMIAHKFYNDIMHGFESEALELCNFMKTIDEIVLKPFITPFPVNLIEKIKNSFQKLKNNISASEIQEIAIEIINYIRNHVNNQIKDSDFQTMNELKQVLEEFTCQRKVCQITIEKYFEFQDIIQEFSSKCIEEIRVIIENTSVLKNDINIVCSELLLKGTLNKKGIAFALQNMKRGSKSLTIVFSKCTKDFQILQEFLPNLIHLNYLSLDLTGNMIGEKEALNLSEVLIKFKHLSTLLLDLTGCNIKDEGANAIMKALEKLTKISTLALRLGGNVITEVGASAIADSLKRMKNISALTLGIGWNSAFRDQLTSIFIGLSEAKHISTMDLDFRHVYFTDVGATKMSKWMAAWNQVKVLSLNLRDNWINDEEIKLMLSALAGLKNLLILNLDLKCNKIGNEGKLLIKMFQMEHPKFSIHY